MGAKAKQLDLQDRSPRNSVNTSAGEPSSEFPKKLSGRITDGFVVITVGATDPEIFIGISAVKATQGNKVVSMPRSVY